MSAVATSQPLPTWAVQLNNPPAHKSKHAGIPDPPGYPSSQSSSSKVASPATRRRQHSLIEVSLTHSPAEERCQG